MSGEDEWPSSEREPRGCPTPGACSAIARIAELEAALRAIAAGEISEGGTRRNHPDATALARRALGLQEVPETARHLTQGEQGILQRALRRTTVKK